ncbi:MAG TPA: hypothetical protein VGD19_06840 [Allosphingosinicella sp.]|jgi:hypothetical protein
MGRIDTLLIENLFSPIFGWVHHRLGVDQWRVALECLNGTFAFYLAGLALTISGKGLNEGIFVDLLTGLAWLTIIQGLRRATCRQAGSSIGGQTARMRETPFRAVLLILLPFSLYYAQDLNDLCHTISLMLLIAHLYFKSCDMPPPRGKRQLAYSRS